MNNSINIGLLVDNLDTDFTNSISKGAKVAARQIGANLYLIPGRYIKPDQKDQRIKASNYQYNTLFDLASNIQFDLVIVLLGSIASTIDADEKKEFLQKYMNAPVVTLSCEMENYCSVMPDNRAGLEEAISHLIEVHGAKKLGMVAGPVTNQDSIERVQVFKDTLTRYEIPVSDDIIVHGNFSNHCTDVVEDLMNRNPGLDAIVFANDQMAVAGYKVFAKRGLEVGKDILVTGFDDDIFASDMEPALTSVNGNGNDIGYKAVKLGMNYLQTAELQRLKAETTLSRRKSCGCKFVSGASLLASCNNENVSEEESSMSAYSRYIFGKGHAKAKDEKNIKFDEKLKACIKSVKYAESAIIADKRVPEDDITKINKAVKELFEMESYSKNTADKLMDVFHMISAKTMAALKDEEAIGLVSDLYFNIYKLISEMNVKQIAKREQQMEEYSASVDSFSGNFVSEAFSIKDKYHVLFDYLNLVQMNHCALYTYEKPIAHEEGAEWKVPANLYLTAYNSEDGVVILDEKREKVVTAAILHGSELSLDNSHARVIMPIFSDNMQYGILMGELESKYYEYYLPINDNVNEAMDIIVKSSEEAEKKIEKKADSKVEEAKAVEVKAPLSSALNLPTTSEIMDKGHFYSTMHKLIERKDLQGHPTVITAISISDIESIESQFGYDERKKVEKITEDVLLEMYGSEGMIASMDDRFYMVCYMDKSKFERTLYPEFLEVQQRIDEQFGGLVNVELITEYVQMNISKNVDVSEYLEKLDEVM